MPHVKREKNAKALDTRPCRARYWATGRLGYRKIRNLMRSGYTWEKAVRIWTSTRVKRLPLGWMERFNPSIKRLRTMEKSP